MSTFWRINYLRSFTGDAITIAIEGGQFYLLFCTTHSIYIVSGCEFCHCHKDSVNLVKTTSSETSYQLCHSV